MLDTVNAALGELQEDRECEPEPTNALALLQSIYRSPAQPLGLRVRCAVEAL
jgi:hypothetical protein